MLSLLNQSTFIFIGFFYTITRPGSGEKSS
jgi:hypothetical protein